MISYEDIRAFQELYEGVNDPAIFKAVFLAGGPGSGKTFIVGKTALTALGFKVVNSDPVFENALRKAGLTTSPEDIWSAKGQEIRGHALEVTKNMMENYINGRLGLVIDGTGREVDRISKQKDMLEKLGYETAMIFVNTDLDTAIERDKMRGRTGGRSVGAKEVSKMWKAVQNNMGLYQSMFGNKMFLIDNSIGSDFKSRSLRIYKQMNRWVNTSPKTQAAKKWIESQR